MSSPPGAPAVPEASACAAKISDYDMQNLWNADEDIRSLKSLKVLSWYEQKAVCILLTLLHLGLKNIYLGPTLPAFLSPNVLNFLVENYNIHPTTTPEANMAQILGK